MPSHQTPPYGQVDVRVRAVCFLEGAARNVISLRPRYLTRSPGDAS